MSDTAFRMHAMRDEYACFLAAVCAALVFSLTPLLVHAADIHAIDHLFTGGGAVIHDGDTVTRDSFSSLSPVWQAYSDWPYAVPDGQGATAVFLGTFGDVAGGALSPDVNYYYYDNGGYGWPAGDSVQAFHAPFPELGALNAPSATYTVMQAKLATSSAHDWKSAIEWFASGGATSTPPVDYSFLTFHYVATSSPELIADGISSVRYEGLTIHPSDTVYLDDLTPRPASAYATGNPWDVVTDWPGAVSGGNDADIYLFHGTFGNLAGAPALEENYYDQEINILPSGQPDREATPSGNTFFGSFGSTTPDGNYTVMVDERDPKDGPLSGAGIPEWFASGGATGTPPLKYALLTFTYKKYHECCSNVAFLPGIEGSVLKEGDQTVWPPQLRHSVDDLAALSFNPDGTPTRADIQVAGIVNQADIGFWNIPGIDTAPDIYQGFTDHMNNLVTSGTIREWKPLPYDWRFSPEYIVSHDVMATSGPVSLTSEVEQLAADSPTGKVTLVAHSYGGLVGKALIKALMDKDEGGLIDNYVMIASPQEGTPQTVGEMLHGERANLPIQIPGTSINIGSLTTKTQGRALGMYLPMAYILLPSANYLQDVAYQPVEFDASAPQTQSWRETWGSALSTLQELDDFLTGNGPDRARPSADDTQDPAVLDASQLQTAQAYHAAFDDFSFASTTHVIQIAGWGNPTIQGILYTQDQGRLDYRPMLSLEGDDTVMAPSAVSTETSSTSSYYFNLNEYHALTDHSSGHALLPASAPVLVELDTIIQKLPIVLNQYFTATKPDLSSLPKELLASVHSPLSLSATDASGNYTGLTPGQDPDTDMRLITNGIPGSRYLTYGDGKYLIVPEGNTYTFSLAGMATGPATIELQEMANGTTTTLATYSDVPVSTTTKATFTITATTTTPDISLDQNGDGVPDATVAPDGSSQAPDQIVSELEAAIQSLDIAKRYEKDLYRQAKKLGKLVTRLEKDDAKAAKQQSQQKRRASTISLGSFFNIAPIQFDVPDGDFLGTLFDTTMHRTEVSAIRISTDVLKQVIEQYARRSILTSSDEKKLDILLGDLMDAIR
ncbi:MAG TPA: hypothetical protein VFL98_02775 [Candidatus Paceibacterota bacterium]|nr:hypothetical protein [Candidatus Paceibacterota bacterium]